MGAFISTLFKLLPRKIKNQEPEFSNTDIESVAQESSFHSSAVELPKASLVDTNEPVIESVVPQSEPNTPISHQAPLYKRKSKPELRIHTPQARASHDLLVHEFIWKYGGKHVFLAGSFNDWQADIEMIPMASTSEYLHAMVALDPTVAWQFKFVVDGVWRCSLELPTVVDSNGNTNNVIIPDHNSN